MTSIKGKKGQDPSLKECGHCLIREDKNKKLKPCSRCNLSFYCDKQCQQAHWKSGHKQFCISKAQQLLSAQQELNNDKENNDHINDNMNNETCVICQDPLDSECRMLSCFHTFHEKCLHQLIQYGIDQKLCPICRCHTVPTKELISSLSQPILLMKNSNKFYY